MLVSVCVMDGSTKGECLGKRVCGNSNLDESVKIEASSQTMLKYCLCCYVSLVFLASCSVGENYSQIPSWAAGGTLHDSTLADWQRATYENKLATVAECLQKTLWKGRLEEEEDYSQMRTRAELLVEVVDFSAAHVDTVGRLGGDPNMPIGEILLEILHGEEVVGENRFGPDGKQ